MKTAERETILQVKVTLLGTKPPIWRRLLVRADITLAQLHNILQDAMGWTNSHLHQFTAGGREFGPRMPELYELGLENERSVRVSHILPRVGSKAIYTYDFGDDWRHQIVVEKRLAAEADVVYPICTGGKRQCPPEDCGGIWGFYNLLDAVRDPAHEEHEELTEWLGGAFDPEAFSVEEVNAMLRPAKKQSVKA
jgi:hypothetical protein